LNPIQILTQNGGTKVLFNKFDRGINLVAFCSVIWGQGIKLLPQNLEILSFKGTSHTNSDSEWGNESFVQQISP
jgi:hypothetical protein